VTVPTRVDPAVCYCRCILTETMPNGHRLTSRCAATVSPDQPFCDHCVVEHQQPVALGIELGFAVTAVPLGQP